MNAIAIIVPLVALGALVPAGIVLSTQAEPVAHDFGPDRIRIVTAQSQYRAGDTVRISLQNVAAKPIDGSPRIMVLTQDGGLVRTFTVGDFNLRLDPGESLWVDWATRAPQTGPPPCMMGVADASGEAKAGMSYPCPMGMEGDVASGASPICYRCGDPGLRGRFLVAGVFGDWADARMIEIL